MSKIFCKMQCAPTVKAMENNVVLADRYGLLRRFYDCTAKHNDVVSYIEKGATMYFGLFEPLQEKDEIFDDGNAADIKNGSSISQERLKGAATTGSFDEKNESKRIEDAVIERNIEISNKCVKLGIFDDKGYCREKDREKYKKMLQETKSPIWSGVILFPEEIGLNYIRSSLDARQVMKVAFPKFLKDASFIKDNVEWFAGLHENFVRKHIHFVFWEKEPLKIKYGSDERIFSNAFIQPEICREFERNIEKCLTTCSKELGADISKTIFVSSSKKNTYEIKKNMLELYRILPDTPFSNYEELTILRYRDKLVNISKRIVKSKGAIVDKIEILSEVLQEKENIAKAASNKIDTGENAISDGYFQEFYESMMKNILRHLYKKKPDIPEYVNKTYKRRQDKDAQFELMREYELIEKDISDKAIRKLDWLINLGQKIDINSFLQREHIKDANQDIKAAS